MVVKITAIVPKEDEAKFRQAMEDGGFSWMQEINPKWVEVIEDE